MSNTLYDDLKDVLEFVQDSGGEFALELCEVKESALGGLGVFAKQDIEQDTILLKIPKSSIFSASNSSIANLLLDEEIDGVLASIIAFIYEITVFKKGSHWYKYLKSIKIYNSSGELVLPPNHWSSGEKASLQGTTLDTLHDGLIAEDEVKEGFQLAVSMASKWHEEIGIKIPEGFFDTDSTNEELLYLRFVAVAYAISSRIFEIDAFHESALVPVADLFNHRPAAPDVHFNSLYDVCELCGEPGMCKHMIAETMSEAARSDDTDVQVDKMYDDDEEDSIDLNEGSSEGGTSDGSMSDGDRESVGSDGDGNGNGDECVEMILVNNISAKEEISNSYGELSNPLLLARYGFCVPSNPLDIVHLGKQISKLAKSDRELKERAKWWSDIGYELYNNWYSLKRLPNDPDDDDAEEYLNPWLAEMYVDFNGHASPRLVGFLNLITLNKKEWQSLRSNIERDVTSHTNALAILERKPNHAYRKTLVQLLSMKESSQMKEDPRSDSKTADQDRMACIHILLRSEAMIIKKAKEILSTK